MKTLKEILNTKPVYLNYWEEKLDVIGDFENIYMTGKEYRLDNSPYSNIEHFKEQKVAMNNAIEKYKNINILFASYGQDNYSGDAWVLFEENGILYEVNGGHCSCFGLEGQWDAEEVNLKELENRLVKGELGKDDWSGNEFNKELKEFLGIQ